MAIRDCLIRRLAWLLFGLLATVSTASAVAETRYMQGLGDYHYKKIDSKVIGRPFHIHISLPDEYEQSDKKHYPTIYVLDGGALFPLFSAYYRYLNFGQEIPDAIIVGISYGSDHFEGGNFRSTDYTAVSAEREHWGGAGKFQTFLSVELFPLIERTFRSREDRRVVFGQSLGGQFVLYSALTKPNLFWGHIASNPALHRNLPFFLEDYGEATTTNERSRLFVAVGSMDERRFRVPALQWIEHWSQEKNHPWHLKTMILDGHSHMSAPPASFREGMAWLFTKN